MSDRKSQPVFTGVLAYFPKALKYVSEVSLAGNKQHSIDTLRWDREKSTDDADALTRHLIDHASGNIYDDDGLLHIGKVAWRSLATLEKLLEELSTDK